MNINREGPDMYLKLLLALLLSFNLIAEAGRAPSPSGLVLKIEAVHDVVKIGDTVDVKLRLSNNTDRDLALDMHMTSECAYQVEVLDRSGRLVPDTRIGKLRNGHVDPKDWERLGYSREEILHNCTNVAGFLFKAGDSYLDSLSVSSLYDFKSPGKYEIRLSANCGNGIVVKSNPVQVTLTN